jgi:4-carboxymuconolactone decarboxylase
VTPPSEERRERGEAIRRTLGGDADPALARMAELAEVAPDLVRFTTEYVFGDLYTRPGLTLAQRELAAVSALGALGATNQLKGHIRYALNAGVSRDELVETLMQLSAFAGWPRAIEALHSAREIFAEPPSPDSATTE